MLQDDCGPAIAHFGAAHVEDVGQVSYSASSICHMGSQGMHPGENVVVSRQL